MKEFDLIGMAAAGGWLKWRREHADLEPGTPCQNCETPLEGPYCHSCGQLAEDMHKSVWKLFGEVLESFFHWDGRLFRTLPNLALRPGRLTRSYLDGKRTSQVPPFRLFLVVLLVAFLVGQCSGDRSGADTVAAPDRGVRVGSIEEGRKAVASDPDLTDEERVRTLRILDTPFMRALEAEAPAPVAAGAAGDDARREILDDPSMTAAEKRVALAAAEGRWAEFGRELALGSDAAAGREEAAVGGGARPKSAVLPDTVSLRGDQKVRLFGQESEAATRWFTERIRAINDDPERFWMVLEIWAQRVIVLALPLSALILSLLFVFQRRFFVFDHLVFSMHSLSFQLLLLTAILLLQMLVGPAAWWLLLLSPVHLFVHMRGTYGTHWALTLLRMSALFVMTLIAFSFLAVLWLYLGLNDMGG